MHRTSDKREGRAHLRLVEAAADQELEGHAACGYADARETQGRHLSHEVASVLARAPEQTACGASLELPLALSACMARHRVDAGALLDVLRPLRRAILSLAGADSAGHPIPIAAGDPRQAAVQLAAYLHDLIGQVARAWDVEREAVTSSAAALLSA